MSDAPVISAEAVFTLTDMRGLSPEEAVAGVVHTARVATEAGTRRAQIGPSRVVRAHPGPVSQDLGG